jgi:protein gp37
MSQDTSIEWTDRTWNPVRGCSRVSKGCENCYAEKVAARFSGPGLAYDGLARWRGKRTGALLSSEPFGIDSSVSARDREARWTGEVRLVPEHLADPLRWKRPRRVFVNSMSDLFHEKLSNEDIAAVFGVMAAAPQHTFQVLTKRAKRMREWFAWISGMVGTNLTTGAHVKMGCDPLSGCEIRAARAGVRFGACRLKDMPKGWPLPNVHLGVSVEDQSTADARIPELLATPAAVRFVSYEPSLSGVDFTDIGGDANFNVDALRVDYDGGNGYGTPVRHLDWLIVGGESGAGARPFDISWARSVVSQCKAAGVACFVKQLGANVRWNGVSGGNYGVTWPTSVRHIDDGNGETFAVELRDRKGGDMSEWPEDLRVREFPGAAP